MRPELLATLIAVALALVLIVGPSGTSRWAVSVVESNWERVALVLAVATVGIILWDVFRLLCVAIVDLWREKWGA